MVLVALVAFEPSLIIPALLLGVLGAVMLRRTPRKIGRIGIALGLPLLVLLPWWPSILAAPGRLFVGPDAALGGAAGCPRGLGSAARPRPRPRSAAAVGRARWSSA